MSKKIVTILNGDGIGPEVISSAIQVLDTLNLDIDLVYADIGWKFWKEEGNALPERTIQALKSSDAALKGPITSKPKQESIKELTPKLRDKGFEYVSPILQIRQIFDLWANFRPNASFVENYEITIFRENTEDLYSGVEFRPLTDELYEALNIFDKFKPFKKYGLNNLALSCRILSRQASERIIRKAFKFAIDNKINKVTVCDKPNILRETGGLFIEVAKEVSKNFPTIQLEITNIDAQCMLLIKNPQDYPLLVATNLFGDILADIAATVTSTIGTAASANIGDKFALFEPVHGSAPDIAGQNIANPIAMIKSTSMMLKYLGFIEHAQAIEKSIKQVILGGEVKTKDMGGNSSTDELTKAIIRRLKDIL